MIVRFAKRCGQRQRERVDDHAASERFTRSTCPLWSAIERFVEHPDSAFAREAARTRIRHGVHRGADDRNLERDAAGESRACRRRAGGRRGSAPGDVRTSTPRGRPSAPLPRHRVRSPSAQSSPRRCTHVMAWRAAPSRSVSASFMMEISSSSRRGSSTTPTFVVSVKN